MEVTTFAELQAAFKAVRATADLNAIAPISGGLTEGYEGKLVDFNYVETTLTLPTKKQDGSPAEGQIIRNEAGEVIFSVPAGGKALSLSLIFDDKTTVAVSTLRRSAKSSINGKAARTISGADLEAMFGKNLKVVAVAPDASTARAIPGSDRQNVGKAYTITVN